MAGVITYTGSPPLASLVKQAEETVSASLSYKSSQAYLKVLQDYKVFASSFNMANTVPLNTGVVLLYLSKLQLNKYSASTITSRLSALNYYHKLSGHKDITSNFIISRFITGLNKSGSSGDTRVPVTIQHLQCLCDQVHSMSTCKYYTLLYRSLFTLSFYAFLRPGEVTSSANNIQLHNITVTSGAATITFTKFKHHTGPPVLISITAVPQGWCPVRSLSSYLLIRGNQPGPLFANMDGSPITYNQYSSFFKLVQSALGLSAVYQPHCFRIGAATHAALLGIPEESIRRMGRWESSAFKKYIRIHTFQR